MKVQDTIKKETGIIAAATAVMTAVMLVVFAALGYFDSAAVIGACIGACAAILDFFLLGITVQKAAEIQAAHPIQAEPQESENGEGEEKQAFSDPETAKLIRKKVRLSYYGRRLMLVAFACTGLLKSVNLAAVVVPMLFPKLFIQARNITGQLPKGVIKK